MLQGPNMESFTKMKIKINNEIRACWCKVLPDNSYVIYTLDGELINTKDNRIVLIEDCCDSRVINTIE
ncbi:MAG: hypothetical protein WC942_03460 [Clostridia bacterium]|jgi:hypothetical protein